MSSQRKLLPTVDGDIKKKVSKQKLETGVIEIDATFGRTVGLVESQKVSIDIKPL